MTRTEAIAIIERSIPAADEATLEAAVRLFQASGAADLSRSFTADELAAIERGKEDFKAGRTFTSAEGQAYIDAALVQRRAQRAAKA